MNGALNISDLNAKSAEELQQQLLELRKEQFALKMSRATGQEMKVHQFKQVRRNIARVKTAISNQAAQ